MKTKFLILIFAVCSGSMLFSQELNFYTRWAFDNPVFNICEGDCGIVMNQPRNSLYTYHDGGFSTDLSRPQMRFDNEYTIDEMMDHVKQNIELRLSDLSRKYTQYDHSIDQHLGEVVHNDAITLTATNQEIAHAVQVYQHTISHPLFQLDAELLDQISHLTHANLSLSTIHGIIDDLELETNSTSLLSPRNIMPGGTDFPGFEFRNDLYVDTQLESHKEAIHEQLNQEKDYDDVMKRFDQFTTRGESDPVFDNINDLLLNHHIAQQALRTSIYMAEDFEKIKAQYPRMDEGIILKWVKAGKTKRYQALGYLPYSDENFRFTVMDMAIVRSEIVSVIEQIQQDVPIPQYACNIYTATLASKLYNIDLSLFQENGQWINANTLYSRAASDHRFGLIGPANNQENLDKAAYMATIGKPVIAIWANTSDGHGHVNILLPGMTDFLSSTWEKYVPWVTNYSITEESTCEKCFNEGRLSNAFGRDKMESTILYVLEY